MDEQKIDERVLRLFKLLLDNGRKTLAEIPEPYKTALTPQENKGA